MLHCYNDINHNSDTNSYTNTITDSFVSDTNGLLIPGFGQW